jgi:hypothetical protein
MTITWIHGWRVTEKWQWTATETEMGYLGSGWKDTVRPGEELQRLWARSGTVGERGMQAADFSEYKLPSTSTPVSTGVWHGCQSQLHLRHPCSGYL